jgi:hypothetical protein
MSPGSNELVWGQSGKKILGRVYLSFLILVLRKKERVVATPLKICHNPKLMQPIRLGIHRVPHEPNGPTQWYC